MENFHFHLELVPLFHWNLVSSLPAFFSVCNRDWPNSYLCYHCRSYIQVALNTDSNINSPVRYSKHRSCNCFPRTEQNSRQKSALQNKRSFSSRNNRKYKLNSVTLGKTLMKFFNQRVWCSSICVCSFTNCFGSDFYTKPNLPRSLASRITKVLQQAILVLWRSCCTFSTFIYTYYARLRRSSLLVYVQPKNRNTICLNRPLWLKECQPGARVQ